MKRNLQKTNIVVVIIGCLCLILVGYRVFNKSNPIIISTTSEIIIPDNINELENDSEFIVVIKVTDDAEEITEFDEDGIPLHGYTLTGVKILEVISGESSSIGDVITIYEPYYYKFLGVQKYLMTIEDYKPMTINNKYILFLRNATNLGDNVYYLVGNQYGKYIANNVILSEITTKNIDVYETDEHYIDLYIDVMELYLDEN